MPEGPLTDSPSTSRLSSDVRLRYGIAVGGIALVSILAHGVVARSNVWEEADARIVNVAGRQRMLSQRLPLLLLRRAEQDSSDLQISYEALREQFFRAQQGLLHGDEDLGVPPTEEGPCREAIDTASAALVDLKSQMTTVEGMVALGENLDPSSIERLLAASDAFLPLMNAAVGAYEERARARVRDSQTLQFSLLAVTLLVLVLEVLLVFEPLRRMLSRQFDQLRASLVMAQSASLAKSRFLATMSHELRTPLNGVVGMVSILSRQDKFKGSDRECLDIIESSANTLLARISDILDFSKLEAERIVLEDIAFEPQRLGQDAIRRHEAVAMDKGLECILDIKPTAPTWMRGDPTRLRQVIDNLLSNAVKFTQSGHVKLSIDADEDIVSFEVEDTGKGIASDAREHIFEAFRQEDTTSTRRFGGTGLGLSIVRGLVQAMGGTLSVDGQVGQGSLFTVYLPRLELKNPPPRLTADLASYLPGKRVLIVDDLSVNHRVLEMQLAAVQVSCVRASDSDEALQLVDESSFDAVLTDYNMPGRNGLELCRALFASGHALPVLLLSSAPDAVSLETMQEAGIRRRLAKPWIPEDLYRALVEALSDPRGDSQVQDDGSSEAQSRPTAQHTNGPSPSVLVVDDERVNRLVAERMLRSFGAEAASVSGGEEALTLLAETSFDLVLMDLSMPDVDGLEATRLLRDQGYEGTIVALTANASSEDEARCHEAGMNDFMTKPVRSERLKQLLARWV
ncbi:MAG: response regulator [Myxococcota bacterium]